MSFVKKIIRPALGLLAIASLASPALAQVTTIDPDAAIDADLGTGQSGTTYSQAPSSDPYATDPAPDTTYAAPATTAPAVSSGANTAAAAGDTTATYREDDLIGAAEGVFGKGAEGLASLISDLLKKQGEPNAYIVGREGSAALGIGLRYGSGTLHHKIEGERPVYWTGPSIGFDAGANAANSFVLVYNLYDSEELYKRFPAGEGQAYFIGGFHVSYMRSGDVVLIPVRVGAGLRLGVNAGYMKFSHNQKWLPF